MSKITIISNPNEEECEFDLSNPKLSSTQKLTVIASSLSKDIELIYFGKLPNEQLKSYFPLVNKIIVPVQLEKNNRNQNYPITANTADSTKQYLDEFVTTEIDLAEIENVINSNYWANNTMAASDFCEQHIKKDSRLYKSDRNDLDHELIAVFVTDNCWGRQVIAPLAMTVLDAVITDVVDLSVNDLDLDKNITENNDFFSRSLNLIAKKQVLSGTWDVSTTVENGICGYAVRPNQMFTKILDCEKIAGLIKAKSDISPEIYELGSESSRRSSRVKIQNLTTYDTSAINDISRAEKVIVAGFGTHGCFDLVEELARTIGATIGATKPTVDSGFAPTSALVGQTGSSITPKLYLGLGVSGAIHHTIGIQGSERIVCVCDDDEAEIFNHCDLGIVGDVELILPELIEAYRKLSQDPT